MRWSLVCEGLICQGENLRHGCYRSEKTHGIAPLTVCFGQTKRPEVNPVCEKKVSQGLLNDYAQVPFVNLVATGNQDVAAEKL